MKIEAPEQAEADVAIAPEEKAAPESKANGARMWKGRINRCKRVRTEMVRAWADNVDYRRGKPFSQESDTDRVNVNLDWSLTKGKHAQLYSTTPKVYLTPRSDAFKPAVPVFQKQLNDRLTQASVGAAVDESVLDAINAAGFGFVTVDFQAKTVVDKVPKMEEHKQLLQGLGPKELDQAYSTGLIPFNEVPRNVDVLFGANRGSPSDFLWPTEFTGSNFDMAPWVGHSGTMLWDEAVENFNLKPEQKEDVCGSRGTPDNLRGEDDDAHNDDEEVVEYDQIFSWAHKFDSNVKYYKKIRRIVFVKGITEPVIDEDWAGQKFDEQTGSYAGSCKFPIRVLTLTYISDDCIPPSDTAIGRPQVLEMIRSRSQQLMQRERSLPVRWYNVNLVDPLVHESLMRGTYQAFIPTNGDGSRIIGEVSRASIAPEEYKLDAIIKQDLQEQWQVSANQIGAFSAGEKSASEANIVQQNFQTRIGYERARVAMFFTGIAEVMAGLIALYDDFKALDQAAIERLGSSWDPKSIAGEFVYYIRPDSTVLLDANQRVDKLMKYLNLVGKSGFVNPKPIIEEITELHDLDPALVIVDPQEPKEEGPKISYSFKGEDLINPMVVAILMKNGDMPPLDAILAAKKVLDVIGLPPEGDAELIAGQPQADGAVPPQADPAQQDDSRPNWTPPARVTKRLDENGG